MIIFFLVRFEFKIKKEFRNKWNILRIINAYIIIKKANKTNLQPNQVHNRTVPRVNMKLPITKGATASWRSFSLSSVVELKLAETPMHTNTSPPKIISGANPEESLLQRRAWEEDSSV